MDNKPKLKPINWAATIIYSTIAIAVLLTGFAFLRAYMSEQDADKISGLVYLGISIVLIIGFIKSKYSILIPMIVLNTTTALAFFLEREKGMIAPMVGMLFICTIAFYTNFRHVYLKRRFLELAARPVDETQNGFTNRPYPAGKIGCSKGELHGFANLLKKLSISVPVYKDAGISFTLPEDWYRRLYNTFGDYTDDTRINIQYNGDVSVHITENDYKKYKDTLTFDQLCSSMGQKFIDLLELFKDGEEQLIIRKITETI